MKIAIISLGCPKNQVDADVFCHALIKDGHTTVADPAEADIIIINTCGFIESAKTEAIENILMACQYKQENPDLKVIVTGCLAERYKQQIIQEIPEVDAVVGIGSNAALPAIVRRVCADGAGQTESYGPKSDMQLGGARVISTPRHYAYLKIAEGCNNGCYYCAIPLIRGALRSREINDCVAEARWLAGEGVRELILVAQDPTAYGEDWGRPGAICELLDRLQEIDGIRWIRILYAYPERISDAFIAAMVRNTKVVPYLDLPIQHCDDAVLKAMNRRGGRKEIEDAIARLRAAIPGITLRTTLIAGFPGETEEQYAELCDFVKTVRFDCLGCFAYSAEENTVAAKMPNGLRACLKKGFEDVFNALDADFFCIQETKMQPGQADFAPAGYTEYIYSADKKGYSGTAIWAKTPALSVRYGLDEDIHNHEGRAITLEYPDFYLVNLYVPNSQNELARIGYRMQWEDDLRRYLQKLDAEKPVILCGDLNVAHEDIDLKNPGPNRGAAGFSDQERGKLGELLAAGFTDSFRYLHPDATGMYSWWSMRFRARERNAGWRIDYFLVSSRLADKIEKAEILMDVMGSDHCPVLLELNP